MFAVGILSGQDRNQIKEPPIPVVIGADRSAGRLDEPSITMTVPDFNYIMEREDSLRRAFSTQVLELRRESDRKSLLVYGLSVGLVVTNLISFGASRRRRPGSSVGNTR